MQPDRSGKCRIAEQRSAGRRCAQLLEVFQQLAHVTGLCLQVQVVKIGRRLLALDWLNVVVDTIQYEGFHVQHALLEFFEQGGAFGSIDFLQYQVERRNLVHVGQLQHWHHDVDMIFRTRNSGIRHPAHASRMLLVGECDLAGQLLEQSIAFTPDRQPHKQAVRGGEQPLGHHVFLTRFVCRNLRYGTAQRPTLVDLNCFQRHAFADSVAAISHAGCS